MEAPLAAQLLALARWTLERWCADTSWREGGPALAPEADRPVDGLFVTLRQGEALRGCIGTLERQDSLDATLRKMAVQAAAATRVSPPVQAGRAALAAHRRQPAHRARAAGGRGRSAPR